MHLIDYSYSSNIPGDKIHFILKSILTKEKPIRKK